MALQRYLPKSRADYAVALGYVLDQERDVFTHSVTGESVRVVDLINAGKWWSRMLRIGAKPKDEK